MNEIRKRFISAVDWVLYHPVIDQLMYNARLQLAITRLSLMLSLFVCLIFGWLEIAIIISFSVAMSQWNSN